MRSPLRIILLIPSVFLLSACNGLQATPTDSILADSFFFGCAYLDSNHNGEIDPDDSGLKDAMFVVSMQGGIGFSDYTFEDGCATIVVPGGLAPESWPVTVRMEPPVESNYELISSIEVVLEYSQSHAEFLFTDSP